MVSIDKNNTKKMKDIILENTKIDNISYVNKYDDKYIVSDDKNTYLFNSKYEEILRIANYLLHENKNNYQIIYKDNALVYLDDYIDKDSVVFKYYDIYTYELIDEIRVGGY